MYGITCSLHDGCAYLQQIPMSSVTGKTNLIIGVSSGIDFSVAGKLASLEDAILTTQK